MDEILGDSEEHHAERQVIVELLHDCEPPLTRGSCLLRDQRFAQIVQDALLYFEGQRYLLWTWCIMPNHVHAIVAPLSHTLNQIEHSWKSFTSHTIGKMLGVGGRIWERESFNHAVRSHGNLEWLIEYVYMNPVTAKLAKYPEDWRFSGRGSGFCVSEKIQHTDARNLPLVQLRSRGELPQLEKPGATYFITFRLWDAVIHASVQHTKEH